MNISIEKKLKHDVENLILRLKLICGEGAKKYSMEDFQIISSKTLGDIRNKLKQLSELSPPYKEVIRSIPKIEQIKNRTEKLKLSQDLHKIFHSLRVENKRGEK